MIAYSQCWEDASLMIKALQVNENDVVLSIGCNTLAIAENNPQLVYSIDKNRSQNYLLELKLAALRNLNYNDVLAFLGYHKSKSNRIAYFQLLLSHISEDCKEFWLQNTSLIERGIVHCGKFEKYLNVFRTYILPLVHRKKLLFELVESKSKAAQQLFYTKKWNTFRWK